MYEASRHLADARAVSLLSPYVHHGQLSARLLQQETLARGKSLASGALHHHIPEWFCLPGIVCPLTSAGEPVLGVK